MPSLADGDTTMPTASAATTAAGSDVTVGDDMAVSPFSDMIADNATAIAASAADTGMGVDTDPAYIDAAPPTADGATAAAAGAVPVGADVAVQAVPTRKRRGKDARRGRDDEYYCRKWLRKAADPSSAPQNGPATPPHGGGGART